MSCATITIALKSGNVFNVRCEEGTGNRPGHELCEEFFAAAHLSRLETIHIGPHIFYCREIERISFTSPGDAP